MRAKRMFCVLFLLMTLFCASAAGEGFPEDYTSLNGQPVPGHAGLVYQEVRFEDAPEVLQITAADVPALPDDDALVWLGAPWCPWCRNVLPLLLETAMEEGFPRVYVIDMTDERDTYEAIGGQALCIRGGTPGYLWLLSALDADLPEYTVNGADGILYAAGEKRIYLPTIARFRRGGCAAALQPGYELEDGQTPYDPLTPEQTAGLKARITQWLREGCLPSETKTPGGE